MTNQLAQFTYDFAVDESSSSDESDSFYNFTDKSHELSLTQPKKIVKLKFTSNRANNISCNKDHKLLVEATNRKTKEIINKSSLRFPLIDQVKNFRNPQTVTNNDTTEREDSNVLRYEESYEYDTDGDDPTSYNYYIFSNPTSCGKTCTKSTKRQELGNNVHVHFNSYCPPFLKQYEHLLLKKVNPYFATDQPLNRMRYICKNKPSSCNTIQEELERRNKNNEKLYFHYGTYYKYNKLVNKIMIMDFEAECKNLINIHSQRISNESDGRYPVDDYKDEIVRSVRENPVLILIGETGSGKTTKLPIILRDAGYGGNRLCSAKERRTQIVCTQPRRLAAISVAERIASILNCEVGKQVGYSIRFDDKTCNSTEIRIMTDAYLLRELAHDKLLLLYDCVILDEAHERTYSTDILLSALKNICSVRQNFKLIITSATIEHSKIVSFFAGAAVLNIKGRTFPITVRYSTNTPDDYILACAKQALSIHINSQFIPEQSDILVFLPGVHEIYTFCGAMTILLERLINEKRNVDLLPLVTFPIYSHLQQPKQQRVFSPLTCRKCIVSTNISETSLTITSVKFVIDCGYCKIQSFNPKIGSQCLTVFPITKSIADQRAGRAGRVSSGFCYRMYTETDFKLLEPYQKPQILDCNLETIILLIKAIYNQSLIDFPLIDKPPLQNICLAYYTLFIINAVDVTGKLTRLGQLLSHFPLDASDAGLLVLCCLRSLVTEGLILVSLLQCQSVFIYTDDAARDYKIHSRFFISNSDHLTLINIYIQWKNDNYSNKFATENRLNYKALCNARQIINQLIIICSNLGLCSKHYQLSMNSIPEASYRLIRETIFNSNLNHIAKYSGTQTYETVVFGIKASVHPNSALLSLHYEPEYLVYCRMLISSKNYIWLLSEVDPAWIKKIDHPVFDVLSLS